VSQILLTVFKSFKLNLLHMIPMKCRCACHMFCEAWPKISRVMALFFEFILIFSDKAGIDVNSTQSVVALV